MADASTWAVFIIFAVLAVGAFGFILLVTRYKRCASDEILVVYGRIKGGAASRCIHGGAVMVWPLVQEYKKISLTPMTISIPLDNALSLGKCDFEQFIPIGVRPCQKSVPGQNL
mgnify:CR=1 FL=1